MPRKMTEKEWFVERCTVLEGRLKKLLEEFHASPREACAVLSTAIKTIASKQEDPKGAMEQIIKSLQGPICTES